jgi:hypothetical protein
MLKQGLFLLALLSSSAFSQDVIYMNDGSVIKGNITEISNDGDVDIEISDGDVFTLKEYNIKKITYEKQISTKKVSKEDRIAAYKNKLRVEDISGSSSGYSSFSSASNIPVVESIEPRSAERNPSHVKHNISVGDMVRTYLNSNQNGYTYTGIGVAYQYNFNKNYALYTAYNIGKLKYDVRNGRNVEPSTWYVDEHIKYIQLAGLVSTNNYKGWQLFTGFGLFSENLTGGASGSSETYDDTYNGYSVHLGAAYSWETFVLRYRMTFDKGDDYPSGALGGSGNLHLSWNI